MKNALHFFSARLIGAVALFGLIGFSIQIQGQVSTERGTALSLAGPDHYVELPNETDFDFTNQFTVELWFRVESFTNIYQALISKSSLNGWSILRDDNLNTLAFRINAFQIPSITPVNDGKWHHVAAVNSPEGMSIYIDGVKEGEYIKPAGQYIGDNFVNGNDHPVQIGGVANYNNTVDFTGQIDEVRIWSTTRTEAEILGNMDRVLSGTESGLVSYFQFNEGSGTIANDLAGNNHGTIYGVNSTFVPSEALQSYSVQTGNWNSASTWLSGNIPDESSFVQHRHNVSLSTNATIERLNLESNTTLTVNNGALFTINGDVQNAGQINGCQGAVIIKGTLSGSGGVTSGAVLPTQKSTFGTPTDGQLQVTLPFTAGDGTGRMVIVSPNAPTDISSIANNTTYTADTDFGSTVSNTIGTGKVVYAGSGNQVTVTNLPEGTYYATVIEYAESTCENNVLYLTSDVSTVSFETTNPISSVRGTALSLAGNGSRVAVGGNEADYDFTNQFSAELWFRVESFTTDWQMLLTKGDDSWRILRNQNTNKIAFAVTTPSTILLVHSTTDVNDGKWHHVAAVKEANRMVLYLDGVQEAELSTTATINNSAFPVYIGGNAEVSDASNFIGQVDEVRIWNTALTAAEIKANMDRTLAGTENGLVSYFQFNEGSGNTAFDYVGGNHGTFSNGATYIPSQALQSYTVQAGDWNTASTWLSGNIPSESAIVNHGHNVSLSANATIKTLNVATGTTFTVENGAVLTVTGDAVTDGDVEACAGDVQVNGSRSGIGIFNVPIASPTVPASISSVEAATSSVNLAWGLGDGDFVAVVVKEGNTPADMSGFVGMETSFTHNPDFSSTNSSVLDGGKLVYLGNDISSLVVTNLQENTTYTVSVLAFNVNGSCGISADYASASSHTFSTGAAITPDVPQNVVASPVSSSSIQVTWDAAANASFYQVRRREAGQGESDWVTVATNVTGTTFTDTELAAGTTYEYSVRAGRN